MEENMTIRDVYDAAPKELEEQNKKIMGLETDMASSTKSGIFGRAFPERYLDMGISELDMVSMSAGSTREGLIPFVSTFVVFLTIRGANPIQNLIAYNKLNVKLCGTCCGPSDSYDGTSHQAITGLAFVRATPNMTVITVADTVGTERVVFVTTDYQDPVYLRFSRATTPIYYSRDMKFETNKGVTVRDDRDVIITTMGAVLHKALVTAELLEVKGIQARVADVHTVKPIDEELIVECARETDAIVTVKEHSACGGLGNVVIEVLAEHISIPMTHIGITGFAESRDYEQPLVKYNYDPESTAGRCAEVIKRR